MPLQAQFAGVYRGKRVLVTGDTGFKGSWLSLWLHSLGAQVIGFADAIPTNPSLFEEASLAKLVDHVVGDVRNFSSLQKLLSQIKPDFVFHLAAQSLVRRAYTDPRSTFETNAIGTLNILESLRGFTHNCVLVSITSDKAYDNVEWVWGYRETDPIGGRDPYSGSKGAAELVLKSYFHSYFSDSNAPVKIGIGRAGNVIGGGDWADDRIVPDAVRAWSMQQPLEIRSPNATRPWQHVLEPLSGYLTLGAQLYRNAVNSGEAFNFGPSCDQIFSVKELLKTMNELWPGAAWKDVSSTNLKANEATLLKLNCDKALHRLLWRPTLTFAETVQFTISWYREFYRDRATALALTQKQIEQFGQLALERHLPWTAQQ